MRCPLAAALGEHLNRGMMPSKDPSFGIKMENTPSRGKNSSSRRAKPSPPPPLLPLWSRKLVVGRRPSVRRNSPQAVIVSFLKALVYVAGGVVVLGMVVLVAFQERLVYVPVLPGLARAYPFTPARLHLDYEDVFLRAADGVRLHSWFVKLSPPKSGPTILFFQENAGSILEIFIYENNDAKTAVQCIHAFIQRVWGKRWLPITAWYYNGCSALDHLTQRTDIDTSRIVVFGRSLGGAVGAMHARNNPDKVSAIILENTFTSIQDMAAIVFPFLKWFIGSGSKGPKLLNFVVRSPWRTIDIIGEIRQPILFLSGLQDELVPPSHMQMLHSKAVESNREIRFVDFPNGMHMDTWYSGGERYWRTIQLFLDHYVPEINECGSDCNDNRDNAAG